MDRKVLLRCDSLTEEPDLVRLGTLGGLTVAPVAAQTRRKRKSSVTYGNSTLDWPASVVSSAIMRSICWRTATCSLPGSAAMKLVDNARSTIPLASIGWVYP